MRLTGSGREQARRLGAALRDVPVDLCVVTAFPRTAETADLALDGRGIPRLEVAELNDPRAGEFEGGPLESYRDWLVEHGALAVPPGGGEPRVQVVERLCRGYRRLLACPEATALVVAHGLAIASVLLALRGEDVPLTLRGFRVEYATPHRLSAADVRTAVERMQRWAAAVTV